MHGLATAVAQQGWWVRHYIIRHWHCVAENRNRKTSRYRAVPQVPLSLEQHENQFDTTYQNPLDSASYTQELGYNLYEHTIASVNGAYRGNNIGNYAQGPRSNEISRRRVPRVQQTILGIKTNCCSTVWSLCPTIAMMSCYDQKGKGKKSSVVRGEGGGSTGLTAQQPMHENCLG